MFDRGASKNEKFRKSGSQCTINRASGIMRFFPPSKLLVCTIFGGIVHPKSQIMQIAQKFFSENLERFLQRSGDYLQRSKLQLFWLPWHMKKIIW